MEKTIREECQKRLKVWENQLMVFNLAKEALTEYEGKVLNRRMITHLKKFFPEKYSIYWGDSYSWFEINIWGGEIPYTEKVSIWLCYKSEGVKKFSMDLISKNGRNYSLLPDYIEKLKNKLENLDKIVGKYESIKKEIELFEKEYIENVYPLTTFFKFN